jgi:fucose 4-O-acetylase-like acetyltransferase
VPFFSWFLAVSVVQSAFDGIAISERLLTLYRSPDYGLWFLWVLFAVGMGSAAILRGVPARFGPVALLIAALAIQLVAVPEAGLALMAWYFPFFAAGLILAPSLFDGSAFEAPRRWWLDVWVLAVWGLLVFGWRRSELVPIAHAWAQYGAPKPHLVNLAYLYVTAAAGIASAIVVVRRIPTSARVFRILRYFGRETLEIYVSHQLYLIPFAGLGLLWAPIAGGVAIVGSLLAANLLKRVGVLRLLLYGGRAGRRLA